MKPASLKLSPPAFSLQQDLLVGETLDWAERRAPQNLERRVTLALTLETAGQVEVGTKSGNG